MSKPSVRYPVALWIDLEMTGLDPVEDRILEVAAIVTDWEFKELAAYEAAVKVGPRLIERRMLKGPSAAFYEAHPACDAQLFASETKFDAHCGWPSFYTALPGAVLFHDDTDHGMVRTEVTCANCGGHLGHVFEGEGFPVPTDQRYCINSLSLRFEPSKQESANE